jgi:hypothetical protein
MQTILYKTMVTPKIDKYKIDKQKILSIFGVIVV